jgi:hypothetical protein
MAKLALLAGIAIAAIYDLLLALMFLLVWAHYDGTDAATNIEILSLAGVSGLAPLIACTIPWRLTLPWRLFVCVFIAALGSVVLATHG